MTEKISKVDAKKLKEKEKLQEQEERREKEAEIISAYAEIAEEKGYVSMNDMIDAGYTKDTVVYYFRNLARLNKEARELYPNAFFDVYLNELLNPENLHKMQEAVKAHKRFFITTAVTGCKANDEFISSIKNFCAKNKAHALILVASDPAHNKFSPGADYGTIDAQLAGDPDISIVVSDIALNTNLCISTVKLSAKHVDPATSMGRIASKNGTFVFASPKQRLKAIPVSNKKFPHFVMTTGAVTVPDYSTDNYMSGRSAFIAEHDHIMGGLIIEVVDEDKYHFRQVQINEDGAFIDLGIRYNADGTDDRIVPEAFVLGDWHSGSTDPLAKKAWLEISHLLKVNKLVMHDLFDGDSINHHERQNVISRAKKVASSKHDLATEMQHLVKDINHLTSLVDEIVVVKSNHDEFLDRYLMSGYYVKDPQNHRYALDLAAQAMDGNDPLQYAVDSIGLKNPGKVRWLNRDEDYKVAGIQLGAHGDLGANGSRGGLKTIEASYGFSITGHSHTPEILRGAWQVGTSSFLKLSYNRGPSSWMHTSCLLYPGGSRQLIHSINGEWRLKDELLLEKPKK
jgi:hypothetical protein